MRIVFLHLQGIFIPWPKIEVVKHTAKRFPCGGVYPTIFLPDLIAERIVDLD